MTTIKSDSISCLETVATTKRKQGKVTDSYPAAKRKFDRFNGMSEEEVMKRSLPDYLKEGLDIIFVGINPGLAAAYAGKYYAGPGNHFWKCLYLSGIVEQEMTSKDDFRLLDYGIGFTNMVARTTRGSNDLSKAELIEGGKLLKAKIEVYKPKVVVFNGKISYEMFSGKKKFHFGKQEEAIEGTNTLIWVMPSSSARCAQLRRAVDKVPFLKALKKLCNVLNGTETGSVSDKEFVFSDLKLQGFPRKN